MERTYDAGVATITIFSSSYRDIRSFHLLITQFHGSTWIFSLCILNKHIWTRGLLMSIHHDLLIVKKKFLRWTNSFYYYLVPTVFLWNYICSTKFGNNKLAYYIVRNCMVMTHLIGHYLFMIPIDCNSCLIKYDHVMCRFVSLKF